MLVLYQPGPAGRLRTSSLSCGMEPTDVTLIDAAVREPVEEADVDPGQAFPASYTPIYIEHEPVPARPAKNEPEHGVQRCFLRRWLADSWPVSVDGGPVLLSTQRLASAFPYVLAQKLCHSGRPETGVHTNSRNSRMPSRWAWSA